MPAVLRGRVALVLALAVLLIPVFQSSLRGLTHVTTCDAEVAQPFTIQLDDGVATILSATALTPDAERGVCGGLVLDMGVQSVGDDRVEVILPVTNETADNWRGTIALDVGGTIIPVDVGVIPAGETVEDRIEVRIDEGTVELQGSVLIGP